jgi:hypothetical protein
MIYMTAGFMAGFSACCHSDAGQPPPGRAAELKSQHARSRTRSAGASSCSSCQETGRSVRAETRYLPAVYLLCR